MRLGRWHERSIYLTGAVIFLSGLGWLVDHYLFVEPTEFGEAHAGFEPWWLRLHGAAAIAGSIALGSLLLGHISRAWRLKQNHRSGLVILSLVALLIATGYGLYYAGGEETRPWISLVHWAAGLVCGAALVVHARLGKRPKRKPRSNCS